MTFVLASLVQVKEPRVSPRTSIIYLIVLYFCPSVHALLHLANPLANAFRGERTGEK